MRRFRQELPAVEAEQILRDGSYGVMALAGDHDYPYALPINYACEGASIYIHCARDGHKMDAIRRNPKCSLCVVAKDDVVAEEFTTYFRSVIAFGRAGIITDDAERLKALRLLCDKYSPGIDPTAEIARCINTVGIVRIDIDRLTGKEAIELTRMRKAE